MCSCPPGPLPRCSPHQGRLQVHSYVIHCRGSFIRLPQARGGRLIQVVSSLQLPHFCQTCCHQQLKLPGIHGSRSLQWGWSFAFRFELLLPSGWESRQHRPVYIHLAGTGDHVCVCSQLLGCSLMAVLTGLLQTQTPHSTPPSQEGRHRSTHSGKPLLWQSQASDSNPLSAATRV